MSDGDRCAFRYPEGIQCGDTREEHARRHHLTHGAFVSPSTQVADEAEATVSKWFMIWRHIEDRDAPDQVRRVIEAAANEAHRIGYAAGARAMRERAHEKELDKLKDSNGKLVVAAAGATGERDRHAFVCRVKSRGCSDPSSRCNRWCVCAVEGCGKSPGGEHL